MDLISFFPRSFFWEGIFIDFLHTPVSIDWKRIIVCRGILYFSLPRCFYYYAIHAFFFLPFFFLSSSPLFESISLLNRASFWILIVG